MRIAWREIGHFANAPEIESWYRGQGIDLRDVDMLARTSGVSPASARQRSSASTMIRGRGDFEL